MRLTQTRQRNGFSLLEVLVSTAIFLIGLAGISQLSSFSSKMAVETQQRSIACRLCESKLNEFMAGIEPVSSGGSGTFEDEPDWQWEVTSSNDTGVNGLYKLSIRVFREGDFFIDGKVEVISGAYVVDPTIKGRADTPQETPAASSTTPADGTTTPADGSTTPSTTTPSTTTPSTTTPSTTTPSTPTPMTGGITGGMTGGKK